MQRSGPKDFSFLTERPFAHRGLHSPGGAPENTIAAFDRAIAGGYGIELDVRLTADKTAIVFHDAELPGLMNAQGRIEDLTSGELAAIKFAGGESIPTLREAILHINGRVPTLIDAKSPGHAHFVSLCRSIRRSIEGANGWAAVMSLDPRIVRWFCDHSPLTVRGLVVTEHGGAETRGLRGWIRRRLAVRYGRPHFLAYDVQSLPSASADRFRRGTHPVLTWTVRSEEARGRAALHADQIIFEQAAESRA